MAEADELYDRLRWLAAEDPKQAKDIFLATFEANSTELVEFLARLDKPNEGRLRQVVANAVRTHPEKRRIVSVLARWRDVETDEFTRRAILGALADVDGSAMQEAPAAASAVPNGVVEVYRYVADRLRHRLRNIMLSAQGQAAKLGRLVPADADAQIAIARLSDSMVSIGKELEATDVDPGFFLSRSIHLGEWLRQMNSRYAQRYSPVGLQLRNADAERVRIFANDYLLEIVFWNIWVNAHQAAAANCEITVEFTIVSRQVQLNILDNGQGFPRDLKDVVFQQLYSSSKDRSRGRGLLEIREAVERLRGRAELYEARPGEFRIRICLPLDEQ